MAQDQREQFLFEPFRFGKQGGVSVTTDPDRHLRDKIIAVLFTAPGERVNSPTFGVGLNQAVFETMDELTLGALEFRIAEGLGRDLGDELVLEGVDIHIDDPRGELTLEIQYSRLTDRVSRSLEIKL